MNKIIIDKNRFIKNNKKYFEMINKIPDINEVFRLIDIEISKKGWNRRKLAQALNKTESWLSNIMNEKRGLSVPILLEIAKVLGVDPASLLPGRTKSELKISFEEYLRHIIRDEFKKINKGEP